MNLEAKDKKVLSDIRMTKALEFLEDARANCNDLRYRTAVNRSNYAVLNAARALLVLEGVSPETHSGIVTMLSLRFVKPALLPVRIVKDFKVLLSRRTDVDYGDFETIDASDARDSVRIAAELIEEVDRLRKEMIGSL